MSIRQPQPPPKSSPSKTIQNMFYPSFNHCSVILAGFYAQPSFVLTVETIIWLQMSAATNFLWITTSKERHHPHDCNHYDCTECELLDYHTISFLFVVYCFLGLSSSSPITGVNFSYLTCADRKFLPTSVATALTASRHVQYQMPLQHETRHPYSP